MANLGSVMTLRELALSHGLTDNAIVEILNKSTPLIEDMAFQNGNQTDGHMFRVRAGLPGVSFRAINEGVKPTRSSTKVVRETCAMMEAVSEIDKKLVDMADDQALFRLKESAAFIEAMGQRFAREVWYGDTGFEPKGIMGLAKRYSDLTGPAKDYILDCGGTGNDNTSIWLIVHSTESFFGIVPKNGKVGLQHFDSGVIDLNEYDSNGMALGTYQGYRDRFQWDVGICLKDYRQVVRACNIDVTQLYGSSTSSNAAADLLLTVNRMTNRVYNLNAGRPVFYMSRTLKDFWERQLLTNHYIEKTIDQATGTITTSYKGIPIHLDDMILDTEERVA
jgi:hypothetical protein